MTTIQPPNSNPEQPIREVATDKPKGSVRKVLDAIKGKLSIGGNKESSVIKPKKELVKAGGKENTSIFPTKKSAINDENGHAIITNLLGFLKNQGETGYNTIGIFRLAANQDDAKELTNKLTKDPGLSIQNVDIHEACDALKKILRQIPFNPTIGSSLLEIGSTKPLNLEKLKELPLTDLQKEILDSVVKHFAEVSKHSAVNKMDAHNLAIILAPLFTPSEDQGQSALVNYMTHIGDVALVFEAAIVKNAAENTPIFK